jgi:nicotinamide mononucleotide transporter
VPARSRAREDPMNTLIELIRPLFLPAFTLGAVTTNWLELLAFALTLAMVACNIRTLWWGWPLAALSSLLYFFLFWDTRVYGQAVLQLLFIGMAVWGGWKWLRGRDEQGQALVVGICTPGERLAALTMLVALWVLLGLSLGHYTESPAPWADGFATGASMTATWLLGRKRIENWAVWLLVNISCVGLFVSQALWLTGLLYVLLSLLSIQGWRTWKKQLPLASGPSPSVAPSSAAS